MRKKILSFALALAMCLGLVVPAVAAYEVNSDKCTYELSNDPIGTVEYNFREWDWENSTDVYVPHTVYIVPDNTTVTSKTAPNGRMPYDTYDPRYSKGGGGNWMNEGEPFVVKPYEEEEVPDENWQVVIAKIPYIYIVKSENMDWDEFGKPEMPFAVDEGIYVVAASAAAEMGLAAQTPSTPQTPTVPETPVTPSTGFTDVAADAYYAAPVTWAVEKGITNGTGNNQFSPGQNCTNAQILTFLWRAYGQPEPTIGNPFTNSIPDAYTKAAIWDYEKGMVSGTAFDMDTPCTRAMAVTYMWQAAGSPVPFASVDSFTDVSADASYVLAVAWALEKGITTGTSATTFSPADICNRGQIVSFLHRNLA